MERLYAQALHALKLGGAEAEPEPPTGGDQATTTRISPVGYAARFEGAARGVGAYLRVCACSSCLSWSSCG